MAAGLLQAWLSGSSERLLWIDFAAYAHHVFARDSAQWLTDPNVYVGAVAQAQAVIKSQVLCVDVIKPYLAHSATGEASPGSALQAALQGSTAAAYVHEVIDALAHRFAAKLDLVLTIQAPATVMRTAGFLDEPSFDEMDDLAIAMSGVLRKLSDKPVSGVMIVSAACPGDDEIEALESITSAARHYGWRLALCYPNCADIAPASALVTDVELYPQVDAVRLCAAQSPHALGGGLDSSYWHDATASLPAGRCLLFGTVPDDAQPELVIQRAALAAS